MSAQYLTLNEPRYVPKYNTLDTNLVNTVNSQIQQQGQAATEYRMETSDFLRESVDTNLSSLNETDRIYAQNVLSDIDREIDEHISANGARNSMNFINKKARDFQQKLNPHFKYVQTKQQVATSLAESTAPEWLKSSINTGSIEYDSFGNATYTGMNSEESRKVNILSSWESIPEYLMDFNSKVRRPNSEESSVLIGGGDSTLSQNILQAVEYLDGGELMINNIEALLSNPKMKEQLALLGQEALKQNPSEVTVDQRGRVHKIEYVARKNADGEYIDEDNNVVEDPYDADVEKKTIIYGNLEHWQASEIAKPFADRDAFYATKYAEKAASRSTNTSTNRSNNTSETTIYTDLIGFTNSQVNPQEYLSGLGERVNSLNEANENIMTELDSGLQSYFGEGNVDYSFQNGQLQIKHGNESYSENELEAELLEKIESTTGTQQYKYINQYDRIFNRIGELKQNELEAASIQSTIKNANDTVINALRDDDRFSDLVDGLSFNDSGEITVNKEVIGKQGIEPKELHSDFQILDNSSRTGLMSKDSIREGQSVNAVIRRPIGPNSTQDVKAIIARENGELVYYDTESGKLGELISKAKELQTNHINAITGSDQEQEVIGILLSTFNEEHDAIIKDFKLHKIGPKASGGMYVDKEGTPITEDSFYNKGNDPGNYFQPNKIAIINGQPTMVGQVFDKSGNPVEGLKNIYYTGEKVTSYAKSLYGNEYANVMAMESFKSLFPRLINGQERVSIDNNTINGMLGTSYKNNIDIEYKNIRSNGQDQDTFVFYEDGEEIAIAHNPYDMVIELLNYSRYLDE